MGELTKNLPKPLIELNGESLISRNLKILKQIGIKKVYINTFYKAEILENYLGNGQQWGLEIICIREEELLDTGGGLLNASKYFTTPNILVWNSDVFIEPKLFEVEYNNLLNCFYSVPKPVISILAKKINEEDKGKYSVLGINSKNRLVKFLGESYTNDSHIEDVIFIGISLISKKFLNIAEEFSLKNNKKIFSTTKDIFPIILSQNTDKDYEITVTISNHYWNDVGNPESLKLASKYLDDHFSPTTN